MSENIKDADLTALNLSVRTFNCLMRHMMIRTVGGLTEHTREEILGLRNMREIC